MSTIGWVDSATAAFTDVLADLVGDGRLQLDPAEAGRRAALQAMSGAIWTDQLGPFYDTEGVRSMLGGVTKQAVNDRVRRHRLLALRTGSGRLVYPAAQFDGRRVVDGLGTILDILVPDEVESWAVASWLTTTDPALGNLTPIDTLRHGGRDAAAAAARQFAITLRG